MTTVANITLVFGSKTCSYIPFWPFLPFSCCCVMAHQALSLSDQMEKGIKPTPQASLKAESLIKSPDRSNRSFKKFLVRKPPKIETSVSLLNKNFIPSLLLKKKWHLRQGIMEQYILKKNNQDSTYSRRELSTPKSTRVIYLILLTSFLILSVTQRFKSL